MAPATLAPIEITDRRRNLRTGRTETWAARTPDGTWQLVRTEEPGTPWWVEHLPTHLTVAVGNITDARRGIATDLLAVMLHNRRADLIRRGELYDHHTTADAYCQCGAPLVEMDGTLHHIDGCRHCVDTATTVLFCHTTATPQLAVQRPTCCDPDPCQGGHVLCAQVRPLICTWCDGVLSAARDECDRGHDGCCGCCEPEAIDYDR